MKRLLTLLASVAVTVTAAHAQDAKGDEKAGEKKASMCIGCHGIQGYQASFPEVYKVPMIAGQNAKFIAAALNAYKKAERRHPTMRAIAESLTDQDIADVAAFYEKQAGAAPALSEQPAVTPSAPVAAMLQKGACGSCHGPNFSKPIDGSYPKIAGQHADYLYAALKAYKTEGNPQVGRGNAIMAAQVKQFSNADLKAVAAYIGSLPGELKTVRQSPFR